MMQVYKYILEGSLPCMTPYKCRYPEIVSEAIVGALIRNSAESTVNFKFTLLPPIHFLRLTGILHSAYAGKQMLLKSLILFLDVKESILDFAWCVVSLSSFC